MTDLITALSASASGMRAQATRMRHVAENIANADTPGYRRKMVPFREVGGLGTERGQVGLGPVQLDRSALKRVHDPAHPLAGEDGQYDGSNVNTIIEVADAREAHRGYEANLRMFDQSRRMSASLLELIRR